MDHLNFDIVLFVCFLSKIWFQVLKNDSSKELGTMVKILSTL